MKFIESKPLLAKEVEDKFKGEEKELTYNEKLMEEHSQCYEITKTKMNELKKELSEIVEEEIAIKICDVLPFSKSTLKTLLVGFGEEVEEEKVDKIMEILSKYIKPPKKSKKAKES